MGAARRVALLHVQPARRTSGPPPARPGVTLDTFTDRYAQRTHGMTASEIRALFAVASRPEVVSLAGGMPNLSALPLDVVGKLMGELVADARRAGAAVRLRPGRPAPARADLRGDGAGGHRASPEDVVVTVGSQQALDLVTRVFIDPGDVVIAEAPSYVGALGTFAPTRPTSCTWRWTSDGLVPEALRDAIDASRPRASARSSCTPCRTSTTPPASRSPSSVARRSSRSARTPG